MPAIYIINPVATHASYHTAEALDTGNGGWARTADLTVTTVAALVPEGWTILVTDEIVSPVDLEAQVDFVAITGKITQRDRMIALSAEFRRRGRTVLIGGSFASLSPEDMRPHADILVTGELEELAPRLFADLQSGQWSDRYDGGKADIQLSPIPRWDLYPVDRALAGTLQTTRGCPFSCEFCDVIQYQGRKQRHKTIEQVVRELDALYACGFRQTFLVDDNFTVHRQWARTVLAAIAEWNGRHADDPMRFITQASLDVARDDEILTLCRRAGLTILFVGIETVNEESLKETRKRQNLLLPVHDAVNRILSHGIAVQAGIIVGFDHDGPGIFDLMKEFFASAPLPDLLIGVLTAPQATDLYRRLEREGRLSGPIWEASAADPFGTNIVPLGMTREALLEGTLDLTQWAYQPENYQRRMLNLIDALGGQDARPARPKGATHERNRIFLSLVRRISEMGPAESAMVRTVLREANRKPAVLPLVFFFLDRYAQARYFLEAERPARLRPSPRIAMGASL